MTGQLPVKLLGSSCWPTQTLADCIEKVKVPAKIPRTSFLEEGNLPIISQEAGFINGYWNDEADLVRVVEPVVVFGDHTQVLKLIDFDFVVGADGVKILKPKQFLDARFLRFYLEANPFPSLGYARHYRHVSTLEVPLPPLEEQKRIVVVLDQAFAALDRARAHAEANLADARRLPQSAIDELFQLDHEGWTKTILGNVCKFIGGSQPPKSVFTATNGPGYIRLIQIRDYKSDAKAVYIPEDRAKRYCGMDDVMIGRYGPPLFQILRGIEGAYNVALIKAKPDEKLIAKDFLFYFLKNGEILRYIIESSSRAAGQAGVNKATLEPYPIAFPDRAEQEQIVERLDQIWATSELLVASCKRKLTDLANLRQSLLQKAFSGELT